MMNRSVDESKLPKTPIYSFSVSDAELAKVIADELRVPMFQDVRITGEQGREGETIQLRVVVEPQHFSDEFQWFMGDKLLNRQSHPVLNLVAVPYALDGVLFSCQVARHGPSGAMYATVSTELKVDVRKPAILSSIPPQQVQCGDVVRLSAAGTNVYDERYQWFFNDQPLAGETRPRLVVRAGDVNQSGRYALEVMREGQPIWSEIELTVHKCGQ
ncbi:hypothetical protein GPK34_10760 [Secundilactobacillus kimchicus]|uniref:hypothetical protein n=1 Tax=Secundilactobacillus kimchicus TaxID=528209 RepID=UPI001C03006D|nr:hypothetical protein [Secundilactobacillus kimchicus]MBT9672505.1 hypothetical protein [Secundilactobacillus kimchicus]